MSMSLWRSGHLKIWHKNMWAAIWQDFSPLPLEGALATAGISMHDPGSAPFVFTAFNKVSKCVLFRPFNMIWICFFFAGELKLVISLHLQQYLVWLPIFYKKYPFKLFKVSQIRKYFRWVILYNSNLWLILLCDSGTLGFFGFASFSWKVKKIEIRKIIPYSFINLLTCLFVSLCNKN